MTEIQEKLLEALSASLKGESVNWEPLSQEELSELYNWKHINCIKDDAIRSVEDINAEIIECLKEYL